MSDIKPEHTQNDDEISSYILTCPHQLRLGDVVRCESTKCLNTLVMNYRGAFSLGKAGKKLFLERTLKDGFSTNHLPRHVYGIIVERECDPTGEYGIELVRVDFFAEHLLKKFGDNSGTVATFWE